MPHAYTDDQRVERPTIALFVEPDRQPMSAMEQMFGQAGTFKRENGTEVVVVHQLRAALERFNSLALPNTIENATDSRLLEEAVTATRIRPVDPNAANKLMRYVPYWA